jgi:GTP pyrophosphokinase
MQDDQYGVATNGVEALMERVADYLPHDLTDQVGRAYAYADECHRGQTRKSGEPYIAHPLETALFLANLHLDSDTIIAALLHDVVEDCNVTLEDVAERFGPEAAKLVDGVTKLTRLDVHLHDINGRDPAHFDDPDNLRAESLRKMLVSMAEDIRVVLIKLADRLHNMQTLNALAPEQRKRIAQETLDIYSPLAHRLGIWEIKWRLDDLAFRFLDEERYREISKMLAAKREEREAYVEKVSRRLREGMKEFGVRGEVVGRPKGIYSTYRKIQKYATQGKAAGHRRFVRPQGAGGHYRGLLQDPGRDSPSVASNPRPV